MGEYSFDFINADRNSPLATVTGSDAKWLAYYSDYIKMLLDNEPGSFKLTLPVSLPTDRALLLRKILRKQPVGLMDRYSYYVQYYPLGPLEEADIQKAMPHATKEEINKERGRVIWQTLSYLGLDPEAEQEMLVYDVTGIRNNYENENEESVRRRKITEKRYKRNNLPFLNEDRIQSFLESHKNYLFSQYGNNEPTLRLKMTKNNIESRKKRLKNFYNFKKSRLSTLQKLQNTIQQRIQRQTRRRRPDPNIMNELQQELNQLVTEEQEMRYGLNPFNDVNSVINLYKINQPSDIPAIELERYLRSLRREGEEKYLPSQRNTLGLENLYGPANI